MVSFCMNGDGLVVRCLSAPDMKQITGSPAKSLFFVYEHNVQFYEQSLLYINWRTKNQSNHVNLATDP